MEVPILQMRKSKLREIKGLLQSSEIKTTLKCEFRPTSFYWVAYLTCSFLDGPSRSEFSLTLLRALCTCLHVGIMWGALKNPIPQFHKISYISISGCDSK